ncbi:amino acid permease [Peribacillus loiseleuriae]|uniref:GABA permease n=1 Tax=Peribacillus loiseleuriae TaxID=1679170 RepID=A0A0K9GVR0_9BACI|nr:GABA permease [Peribacillus loiseleuriae]
MEHQQEELKPGLKQRHLTMISLSGVIGAGLFVGSGIIISQTGPGAILSYAFAGLIVVLVMRMLGEMATVNPNTGSFAVYAREGIGEWAGFATGWLYWFFWVIVIALEATAGAAIIHEWLPSVPVWLISLTLIILLTLTNIFSVKSFGEFEYWFSIIKIGSIIVFLSLGVAVILGVIPTIESPGATNLMNIGGFIPNGIGSVLVGIAIVFHAFVGVEIPAIAAGETSDPVKSVRGALNSVVWRILIFYIGSIAVVVTLLPWNSASLLKSPFVAVLEILGIPYAALIMNIVVLTALLSCLNSGLYTSSRMLFSLAQKGDAPRLISKVSKNGVPVFAVIASTSVAFISTIFSYTSPDKIFFFLVNSSGGIGILVYLAIAISHLRLRKRMEKENPEIFKIKMWFFPYLTYATIIAMLSVLLLMAFIDSQRPQFIFTMLFGAIVIFSYFVIRRKKEKYIEKEINLVSNPPNSEKF